MTAMQRRFKAVLERIGDDFTVGGSAGKGIFTLLGRDRAADFLTDAEVAAATLPLRLAYVPFDDATAAAQTVVWDGLDLAVQKVVSLRAKGETVAKILVLG